MYPKEKEKEIFSKDLDSLVKPDGIKGKYNFVFEGQNRPRLDLYLTLKIPDLSRSQIQKIITQGLVQVNQARPKSGTKLSVGDRIEIAIPNLRMIEVKAQPISLEILYEDPFIIVLNKPAGMIVHPAGGKYEGTLVNALLYHFPDLRNIGGILRPGIVHRLDKETSGIMVVAKDNASHHRLSLQFKQRRVKKKYLALVHGITKEREGTFSTPIGRHPTDRKRLSVWSKQGREAVTHWRVSKWFNHFTLLEIIPETGRTHQIRVHLAAAHHPVLGDRVYGKSTVWRNLRNKDVLDKVKGLKRHLLHAQGLGFIHPQKGFYVEFESPLPEEMREMIEFLKEKGG